MFFIWLLQVWIVMVCIAGAFIVLAYVLNDNHEDSRND